MRKVIFANIVALVLVISVPVYAADWNNVDFGMTVQQVEKAMKKQLSSYNDTMLGRHTSHSVGSMNISGHNFAVYMNFSQDRLDFIAVLNNETAHSQIFNAINDGLLKKYGQPSVPLKYIRKDRNGSIQRAEWLTDNVHIVAANAILSFGGGTGESTSIAYTPRNSSITEGL